MVKMSDIFKKIEERKKEDKASQLLPATVAIPPATSVVAQPETVSQPLPPPAAETKIISEIKNMVVRIIFIIILWIWA